jgi:hypothetical protein
MTMSTIPAWLGAQVNYGGNSGLINQFLAQHDAIYQYSGQSIASEEATGSGIYIDTLNQWLSQTITTGPSQTDIGAVGLQLSTVGGSPTLNLIPALTVSLYADLGGFPTGSAITSATVASTYVYSSSFWAQIPLVATGLTASTNYHLVTAITGTTGHYYVWQESNQTNGCLTAPDGVTWTAQGFGLMYQVYTQDSASGNVVLISEDNGSLVKILTYNSLNLLTNVSEYAQLQDGTFIQSSGTLSYTNGLVTGVS